MIQRSWQEVVSALVRLGCAKVREDDFRLVLCRGAAILHPIPKISPVPIRAQRRILEAFSFSEAEYLEALPTDE